MVKKTFHTLVIPNGEPCEYTIETYEKPFNVAPFDTLYGQDFDVMIYVGNEGAGPLEDLDIMIAGLASASRIQKTHGLTFGGLSMRD